MDFGWGGGGGQRRVWEAKNKFDIGIGPLNLHLCYGNFLWGLRSWLHKRGGLIRECASTPCRNAPDSP